MMNNTISKSEGLKKGEAQTPSHGSQEGDIHNINAKSVVETRISAKAEETEAGLKSVVDSPTQSFPQATQDNHKVEISPPSPFHRERVGHAPTTPGRSKLKSFNYDDETPNHSVTVPKFGDWNEDDPLAADDYSGVFRKIREEKQNGGTGFVAQTRSTYSDHPKRLVTGNFSRWCCLQWTKK